MAGALTTVVNLLVVRDIEEDAGGATLRFQEGPEGRLLVHDAGYTAALRLARRSHERQHPVGVCFGEGHVITELLRADNDVPAQLSDEDSDGSRIVFQGHDGVFRLKPDHPHAARLRAILGEALRQGTPVWFVAVKGELALVDVRPGASM